jgi:DNA polymerase-3 subunit delta'
MNEFIDLKGQEQALQLLQKALATDHISHAYLFQGPAGTGKKSTARAFAAALLTRSDADAQLFLKDGVHPDLMILTKPDNRTVIGKDQISRELEPWLAVKPYRASYKIAVISEAALMSLEAANALLKTLEEPPAYAVIILVADQAQLLETIVSRCQRVRFHPLPDDQVEWLLLEQGMEREKARQVARLAQGSPGTAFHFAAVQNFEEIWNQAGEAIKSFSRGEYAAVFETAKEMEKDAYLYCSMLEIILRDICIYQTTNDQQLLAVPANLDMLKAIPGKDADRIKTSMKKIAGLKYYYKSNVNPLLININICYEVLTALQ